MKSLKDYIFEGSWGYEPLEGDYPLGDLNVELCRTIYDKCHYLIYEHSVNGGYDHKGDYSWCAIAQIEWYFDRICPLWEIPHNSKARSGSDKYYYWWRLAEKEGKNIIELYHEALGFCQADQEWIKSWKEPNKMKASLKKREDNLKKYQKLFNDYIEKKKKNEEERAKAEADCIANPNKSLCYTDQGWVALDCGDQGCGQVEEVVDKKSKKKNEKSK